MSCGDGVVAGREQSTSGESILAHVDNGELRDDTCQSSRHDLPASAFASLQYAELG